jgi:hypothetical protein
MLVHQNNKKNIEKKFQKIMKDGLEVIELLLV